MSKRRFRSGGAAAFTVLAFGMAVAQEPEKGVLWETTAQAEIPGLPARMPAYTTQSCSKEQWTQPPETSQDSSKNCRHTSFNQTPTKATWTMECDNPPMTGEGEITFDGRDAFSGFVTMHSDQMNMKIHLSGRKLGTCNDPQ